VRRAWAAAACALAACASVSTARLRPEDVHVGPGLRPIAALQASASSVFVLFVPLPGGVDLDRVVNRMLIATAKTMGADKIANLSFHAGCPSLCLARLLGVVSTHAHGIAVQVETPPPDPSADDGPEAHIR
jgi:hypothetical protein